MYKIHLNKVAFYLIPLIAVSPLIRFGPYGMLLTDAVIIIVGLLILSKARLGIKNFFFLFLLLFTIGWICSNLWALIIFKSIPQVAELNHLYRILFYYSAFWIGYQSKYSIEEILSSRYARIIFFILSSFVILYILLNTGLKIKLMSLFVSVRDIKMSKDRFPGLNSNINVYSFIILMITLFSFHYLLKGNRKLFIPFLLTSFVLLAGRSRKILFFYLVFIIFNLIKYYFFDSETRIIKHYRLNFTTAILLTAIIIGLSFGSYFFLKSNRGERIIAGFKILVLSKQETQGLRSHYGTNSDFSMRFSYMKKGLQRVAESPIFGIPKMRDVKNGSSDILYFHKAHNEFIVIWMYYGIIGLLAFVYFLFYIIYFNYRKRQYIWVYLYIILMLQAFFDTAFFSYQLCSILFIFIGLNFNEKLTKPLEI